MIPFSHNTYTAHHTTAALQRPKHFTLSSMSIFTYKSKGNYLNKFLKTSIGHFCKIRGFAKIINLMWDLYII